MTKEIREWKKSSHMDIEFHINNYHLGMDFWVDGTHYYFSLYDRDKGFFDTDGYVHFSVESPEDIDRLISHLYSIKNHFVKIAEKRPKGF